MTYPPRCMSAVPANLPGVLGKLTWSYPPRCMSAVPANLSKVVNKGNSR